jgi:hypothetical protein
MNIFFLHLSPKKAAEYHCDKHVVKMIIETAQLLYTAHWLLDPDELPENAYKKAHVNHPCAIWARKTVCNYMWLASLGWWLCKEYSYRYGEDKVHKTQSHIEWLLHNPPRSIPYCAFTRPALAMPDEYKQDDYVQAYRTLYIESKLRKRGIVKYTKRERPEFLPKE